MELTKEIYLNCGIYRDDRFSRYNEDVPEINDILFIAVPSYFASDAWCKGDEIYNEISGRKFEAITADDNESYNLDRKFIRRLTEEDNIDELLEYADKEFIKIFNERFNILWKQK